MAKPIVVDADGHVLEPADLWVKNLPVKFKDRALRTVSVGNGRGDALIVEEDTMVIPIASAIGAARWPEEMRRRFQDFSYIDGDPAGFDPGLRINENDREGIDVAFLYPSMALYLNGIRDLEHAALACRIYNDWLADYCAHAPDRFVGIATLPWQDPPAAARELRRAVTDLNFRGAFIRPNAYNDYYLHNRDFDVVWAEAQDLGVPIGIHPGGTPEVWGASQFYGEGFIQRFKPKSLTSSPQAGAKPLPGSKSIFFLFDNYVALTVMIGTGVLERFPKLKVIVLESGGGWLAHWLDSIDHEGEIIPQQRDGLSLRPSEYFMRQCYISCDPEDHSYRFLPGLIGEDKLMWASDFPHFDVTVPSVTDELNKSLAGVEPKLRAKILGENALKAYDWQPRH